MSQQRFTLEQVKRAQELVCRIHGISSCQISTNQSGEITEVHVVATAEKSPKFIARDVESCLKAEMDMDVDYKKIGVVIFDSSSAEDAGDTGQEPIYSEGLTEFPIEEHPSRFAFRCVNLFVSQDGLKAEVELSRDGLDSYGTAHNDNPTVPPWSLIAEAVLRAVSEYLDDSSRLCLGEVRKIQLSGTHAFVVAVDVVNKRYKKTLAGCSIIFGNENQAVVFATLDAINRVLGKLDFKSSIEYKIE